MTIAFASMLDDVLPDVAGCSTALATNAIRNTVIELYKKTQIKTTNASPITVIPTVSVYALQVAANLQIVGVKNVYLDGNKLNPVTNLDLQNSSVLVGNLAGDVLGYQVDNGSSIHLYRNPKKTGILDVLVAVAPNTQAVEMDSDIYYLYSEAIAAGAKARLMSIPKKPFSDSATAMMYRQQFSEAVRDAHWRALKGNTLSEIKVQFRTRK